MREFLLDFASLYPSISTRSCGDDDDATPEHASHDGGPTSIANPRPDNDDGAPTRKCPGCKRDCHAWMGFQSGCEGCGPICVQCLMAARLTPSHLTTCPGCGLSLDCPIGLINQQQLLQQQQTNMVGYLSEGVAN